MNHGRQSESTDGPEGGWSSVFKVVAAVTSRQLLGVVWCSAVVA